MTTRESLNARIAEVQADLAAAVGALAAFEALAENNVFATLDEAERLEGVLLGRAGDDCEGAGNCGSDKYTQEFMVDGKTYIAILTVEYNRHDKTYYYIDDSEFEIEPKQAS